MLRETNDSDFFTDDEGFFGLSPMFVVPGRAASRVDGSLAGPKQRRFWFALAGRSFTWRQASVDGRQESVQRAFPSSTAQINKQGRKMEQSLLAGRRSWTLPVQKPGQSWWLSTPPYSWTGRRSAGEPYERALLYRYTVKTGFTASIYFPHLFSFCSYTEQRELSTHAGQV